MVLDEEGRRRALHRLTSELAGEPEVVFGCLYGSFLEGLPFEDVDVGVYLRTSSGGVEATYDLSLADRLSKAIRLPVDVRVLNHASTPFLFHVLRGHLLFCRDDDLLAGVMERTAARYLDIAPVLRQATREAFGT
jgi:predicted nucleotidyltransferase